ncbi:MAG: HAD family hydrolase [Rhodospirillaceae bacterium]
MNEVESLRHADFPQVGADGVWSERLTAVDGPARPALFLDRDGVIVEEVHYLHRVADMRLCAGAATVIRRANEQGLPVVVVTNQSGIGRGTFTWRDFAAVQDAMLGELAALGAYVNAVFACPFHGSGVAPWNVPDHPDRKPAPGMLTRAQTLLPLDLGRSWLVGDRAGDMGAAKRAGLAGALHVLSGHGNDAGERAEALALADDGFRVLTGDGVADSLDALPLFGAVQTD